MIYYYYFNQTIYTCRTVSWRFFRDSFELYCSMMYSNQCKVKLFSLICNHLLVMNNCWLILLSIFIATNCTTDFTASWSNGPLGFYLGLSLVFCSLDRYHWCIRILWFSTFLFRYGRRFRWLYSSVCSVCFAQWLHHSSISSFRIFSCFQSNSASFYILFRS